MDREQPSRRSSLAAFASAVGALLIGSRVADAQDHVTKFQPAIHPQDAWLDALAGKHRTFIDTSTVNGGGTALLYAFNLFYANKSDYSLSDQDVSVIVGFRHESISFGFNDAMWAKYTAPMNEIPKLTNPKTKQPPTTNLFLSVDYGTDLPNFGTTIQDLVKMGTHFAVCKAAARGLASSIADATGQDLNSVLAELTANMIPNSHMVMAGVVTVNRAQEHGYTLLTAL